MGALLSFLARVMIVAIFAMSALGNKIPKFNETLQALQNAGVPEPRYALYGAIVFCIAGSISVALGLLARFGAFLLLVFLGAATYYFHAFWKLDPNTPEFQGQMIHAMKNLAIAGAMLFIIANGAGAGSLDNRRRQQPY